MATDSFACHVFCSSVLFVYWEYGLWYSAHLSSYCNSLPSLQTQMAELVIKAFGCCAEPPTLPVAQRAAMPPGRQGKFKVKDWQRLYISPETLMPFLHNQLN